MSRQILPPDMSDWDIMTPNEKLDSSLRQLITLATSIKSLLWWLAMTSTAFIAIYFVVVYIYFFK